MKKYLVLGLALCLLSTMCFGESLLSTTFGYGHYGRTEQNYDGTHTAKLQLGAFDVGLSFGQVSDSAFTFMYNTSFMVNPPYNFKIWDKSNNIVYDAKKAGDSKVKGFLWNNQFLVGGTLRFIDKSLYLTLATGPTFSFGIPIMKTYNEATKKYEDYAYDVETSMTAELGFGFHIEVSYFFLDWLGVSLSLTDTVGVTYNNKYGLFDERLQPEKAKPYGFGNIFQVKAGPKFRVN